MLKLDVDIDYKSIILHSKIFHVYLYKYNIYYKIVLKYDRSVCVYDETQFFRGQLSDSICSGKTFSQKKGYILENFVLELRSFEIGKFNLYL